MSGRAMWASFLNGVASMTIYPLLPTSQPAGHVASPAAPTDAYGAEQ